MKQDVRSSIISTRVTPRTKQDIEKLSELRGSKKASVIRFLLFLGFRSMGNWRSEYTNAKKNQRKKQPQS
jgi:hypothetical protein